MISAPNPKTRRPKVRKNVVQLAQMLLSQSWQSRKTSLRHDFRNDEECHDDELQSAVAAEFTKQFIEASTEMTATFGPPSETGEEGHEIITVGGVFGLPFGM